MVLNVDGRNKIQKFSRYKKIFLKFVLKLGFVLDASGSALSGFGVFGVEHVGVRGRGLAQKKASGSGLPPSGSGTNPI
jgi:hypothetical protein